MTFPKPHHYPIARGFKVDKLASISNLFNKERPTDEQPSVGRSRVDPRYRST